MEDWLNSRRRKHTQRSHSLPASVHFDKDPVDSTTLSYHLKVEKHLTFERLYGHLRFLSHREDKIQRKVVCKY